MEAKTRNSYDTVFHYIKNNLLQIHHQLQQLPIMKQH